MIRLDLLNVGLVEETGGILVILRAPDQERLLVFETGITEGRAIAMEAGGQRMDRPQPLDLLAAVIAGLGARVEQVAIHDYADEAFHAEVQLIKPNGGSPIRVDARPSDAIALAMRADAPIFVSEKILAEMGVPEEPDGRFAELYADDELDPSDGRTLH
jgi:bifunctional DNase/RNase